MAGAIEVADIFRRHGEAYRQAHGAHLGYVENRIMSAIAACRTAALGGHVEQCANCKHRHIAYNSCRNRHCPKCQNLARAEWLAARQAELLPVPYFHIVFTLPTPLAAIAFHNKAIVYDLLMRTAAAALRQLTADPRHLGADIGIIAVLHTWGQNLQHHPHVHTVVPGGGLAADGARWIASRSDFFVPVKLLSARFRELFLAGLAGAYMAGRLRFFADLADLAEPIAFSHQLDQLRQRKWVVYAKPPWGRPEQVLAYLARYTHRVAIANSRLLALQDGKVSFRWKDYRSGGADKVMTLAADEFIRRFLLHALPDGFQRIRHYGLFANSQRAANLARVRALLNAPPPSSPPPHNARERLRALTGRDLASCPQCGGTMVQIMTLPRPTTKARHSAPNAMPWSCDSS
jgi:Putative transposase/Transposase zinc-binding domain